MGFLQAAHEPPFVMPVKTGIQCLSEIIIKSLDSRFRGNDGLALKRFYR